MFNLKFCVGAFQIKNNFDFLRVNSYFPCSYFYNGKRTIQNYFLA